MLVRDFLRQLDGYLWRLLVGAEDYKQLHPPISKRLRMACLLPFFLAHTPATPPVFIVGSPRSGTTLLFQLLAHSSLLDHLGQESHWLWEFFHPPAKQVGYNQLLEPDDLTHVSRAFIRGCYGAAFGKQRFVDKCPTNTFRVLAIKSLFPTAKIVAMYRNGPDTVSSLIDTWLDRDRFMGFDVPQPLQIEGYSRQKWVHLLEPGWQAYTDRPLEEVCTHQWVTCNCYLLQARKKIPATDWIDIYYEELIQDSERVARELFAQLELPWEEAVHAFVAELDRHVVNTQTKPAIGKWKDRHPAQVLRVRKMIEPTMLALGYQSWDI